jgi:carboxylesterase type B
VVRIHGGGFTQGSSEWESGIALLRHAPGSLIFVSLQYRLGAYGFLSGQEIAADGAANAGLLDQRLAIEWVNNHIGRFGGDPNRIVIEGGSAGGGSVTAQLMLYGGGGSVLFQAAIPGRLVFLLLKL